MNSSLTDPLTHSLTHSLTDSLTDEPALVLQQLERLQAENAQEWGRRERLETEKLALERENKNQRTEMANLREELDRKGKHTSAIIDSDIRSMQADISERTKVSFVVVVAHGAMRYYMLNTIFLRIISSFLKY